MAAFVIVILMLVRGMFREKVSSTEDFQEYIRGFGYFAPVALTVFQAMQVVVPVLPGYLGCAAGAVAFGTGAGFLCNYIGISAGSIIAYFLAKKYGADLIRAMFPAKVYDKWSGKVQKSRSYEFFLFTATLLPLFPDDFLCYFSGVARMNARRFIWIILLGKPWCILAYSIFFGKIS